MSTEQPNSGRVETGGGAYVAGNVQTGGGEFVGRDSIKPLVRGSVGNLSAGAVQGDLEQEGLSLAEFQHALREFTDYVRSAQLGDSIRNAIIVEAEIVATESQAREPDKALILHKVNSISQLLARMSVNSVYLTELGEFAHRLAEWAGHLFG